MATLHLRGVPEDVYEALKEEARRAGRSLTSIGLEAVQAHVQRIRRRNELAEVQTEMAGLRERIRQRVGTLSDSSDLISQDRQR
ncbi:MAG: hypothetical protein AB1758_09290 [Candidatus Eremiobacterota bacterium]